ncbi:MAG TPA: carotenoid oxygenase family protein [Steroidobacteraceae bacterium]|nr:carotenoid oxygenase family protein [Steroidobacteraceae bacterium]
MSSFPATANFQGFMRPARYEVDLHDLEVEGTVPSELDGAFYRVQPDPQFSPKLGDDIWFNGDGMVSMFRFQRGSVDLKHRWIRSDKWKLENAAGHALFGAYRNPLTDDPAVKGRIRGTANTNVLVHGGRLWALKEDSPPIAMDPDTLATEGYCDFGGRMKSETFTAHPKIDPHTGDLCAFGYAAKGLLTRDIVYYEITPSGKIEREVWFELPYYCMMHDFGVTRDYACFHVVPIVSSWERLRQRLPHFGFDTTLPVYFGVLPRTGTARDVRWFKTGNLFASHVLNAFNEGPRIYFDIPVARNNMFPFFPDVHGAAFDPVAARSHLTRWTIDMSSKGDGFASSETLSDLVGEFPRIDDRYAMSAHRHAYLLVADDRQPAHFSRAGLFMNTLGYVDLATRASKTWWCGPTSSLQEPAFVPKSARAAEGEGYIVMLCNRLAEMLSDLLVFDAQHIDAGPIATVHLPLRLRPGLHGNWHPSDRTA